MNPITVLVWGCVALGVLGLFIASAGAVAVVRQSRSRRGVIFLVLGLLFLGVSVGLGWYNWPLLLQQFGRDVDDPRLKARLRDDSLDVPERPKNASEEWPQWRGSLRDGISPETGLATIWPKGGPKVVWRRPIRGGYSSISVAGGRLYLRDNEEMVCLDLRN